MVRRAIVPGSFDPPHHGHIDIIVRAATLFDEVVVAVGVNKSKTSSRLFSSDERLAMLDAVTDHLPNVTTAGFTGLIVDFCQDIEAVAIVKGLRGGSDYEYELQMAQMNSHLTDVETVFIPTAPEYAFVSSSLVREVATLGGDVSDLVPEHVHRLLTERLAKH
ncbi:phosphopantetheine adenylyltransferase [Nocardioides baekrokdamisoli]|uniref:Phosphopantetheine adenylyltransferase n=1 Tax=Nocardioides baekrokdamisoli TaxID=1804624 RepID=A0A3G9IGK9_9ACTN|nr:phosphopantetheine adenylyltransferase [Nocardioides baekrokdamisoli]